MSAAQLKNIESRLSKCESKVASVNAPAAQQVQVYDDSMLVSRISLLENKLESLQKQLDEKNQQLKEHCNSVRSQLEENKCNCNCKENADSEPSEVQDEQKPVKASRSGKKK